MVDGERPRCGYLEGGFLQGVVSRDRTPETKALQTKTIGHLHAFEPRCVEVKDVARQRAKASLLREVLGIAP